MTIGRLAREINRFYKAHLGAAHRTLDYALQVGELLLEARRQVLHGEWLPWVRENCRFPERTAQHYMQLSHWAAPQNPQTLTHLSYSEACALMRGRSEGPPYSMKPPRPLCVSLEFKSLADRAQFFEELKACGGKKSDPLPTIRAALRSARLESAA